MTDRLKGFVVTLDRDLREDDAECVIMALRMIRGVIDVAQVPANPDDHMNRERALLELREQLRAVLWPKK